VPSSFKVAVLGGNGYSGQVLATLLKRDPQFEVFISGGRNDDPGEFVGKVDLAFLCLPHEVSLEWAPRYLAQGSNVVDLSGAFRLKTSSYPEWYGFEHHDRAHLERAVYGLQPFAKIPVWKKGGPPVLVANPGCYATAVQLLLAPLLKAKLINPETISISAKSGTTGAGRKASTDLLFSEISNSYYPYRTGRHQHWPEIVEGLGQYSGVSALRPAFVTELIPIDRGILVTAFLDWNLDLAPSARKISVLEQAWQEAFKGDRGFQLAKDDAAMNVKHVRGTNHFALRAVDAFGRVVAFCSIDNLMRGAASQALMNGARILGTSWREEAL
jgi:N-acetyl-gamma-glutamyl-phosphate reductase